jgi:single-strand DNA-binding protein
MASLNRVFLIGNLTRDPEIRYLTSGKAVAELRLAINRRYKTATGEDKEEVCFVNVVVWGRQAETCGQYLSKGSALFVDGRLQYEEWEKDGQKNNRLRVVADRTQFIGAPRKGVYSDTAESLGEADSPARDPAPVQRDRGGDTVQAVEGGDEDNLPF